MVNSQSRDKTQKDKPQTSGKITSYQDLIVWQKANFVALEIYKLSKLGKKSFSDWEIWKQALAAGFSVPANIVEGFHSHRGKSYASHLEIARGSAGETDYWLYVLVATKQIDEKIGGQLRAELQQIIAMLTALIAKLR